MYTVENFRTKKAVKDAVKMGQSVYVFQPGPFGDPSKPVNGTVALEGPHYPEPHRWYASAVVKDGCIVSIR